MQSSLLLSQAARTKTIVMINAFPMAAGRMLNVNMATSLDARPAGRCLG